jgi:predicted RNA-binding Zn-ribbon protein involved in translation (DUF1610 family)
MGFMSDRSTPSCRVCKRPMYLLDEEEQGGRWYCYGDNVLVIDGVEVTWKDGRYTRKAVMSPALTAQSSDELGRICQERETASGLGTITCPKCGKENLSKAAYCEMCGSLLHPVKCPRCSETNRPWANFCIGCGQSLDSTRIYH